LSAVIYGIHRYTWKSVVKQTRHVAHCCPGNRLLAHGHGMGAVGQYRVAQTDICRAHCPCLSADSSIVQESGLFSSYTAPSLDCWKGARRLPTISLEIKHCRFPYLSMRPIHLTAHPSIRPAIHQPTHPSTDSTSLPTFGKKKTCDPLLSILYCEETRLI
jgi:hypothetical protein